MTNDPPTLAEPGTAAASGRRPWALLLIACALAAGLWLALSADGAAAAAHEHLARAAADPDGAFLDCAPGFAPAPSLEAFRAFVATHPEWYQAERVRFSDRTAARDQVTLVGSAISSTGEAAPVEVELVKGADRWLIAYVGPRRQRGR